MVCLILLVYYSSTSSLSLKPFQGRIQILYLITPAEFLAQCLGCPDILIFIHCYWMRFFKNRYLPSHLFLSLVLPQRTFFFFPPPNLILRCYQNHFSRLVKYRLLYTFLFTEMSEHNNFHYNTKLIPVKVENLVCSKGGAKCSTCNLEIFLDFEKISA